MSPMDDGSGRRGSPMTPSTRSVVEPRSVPDPSGWARWFLVMWQGPYSDEPEVVAAFRHEGRAAAYLTSLGDRSRKYAWLEKDGRTIENVRYREEHPGGYGHAWAFAERVAEEERERLAKAGFRFVDTGRTP